MLVLLTCLDHLQDLASQTDNQLSLKVTRARQHCASVASFLFPGNCWYWKETS